MKIKIKTIKTMQKNLQQGPTASLKQKEETNELQSKGHMRINPRVKTLNLCAQEFLPRLVVPQFFNNLSQTE